MEKVKEKDRIQDSINNTNFKENSIDVDIGVAWMLFENKILKYKVKYDIDSKKWYFEEIRKITPFSKYILEKNDYDENIGVKNDTSYFI
ncbi:hypothetical protein [Thermodesulfovibrio sp. 3462-1]|uniref:hypothetical protein n=1 Tax=Thermodesulfovibrio obliviosus TaxID=3118332 RepID=UPI00339076B1